MKYRGVHRPKHLKRWQATIYADDGRRLYLGSFVTAIAAAACRHYAALELGKKSQLIFAGRPPLLKTEVEAARVRGSKRTSSTSVFRGVSKIAGSVARPWRARLVNGGHYQHLGCFENEEAAARAYNTAAKKLNFPRRTVS